MSYVYYVLPAVLVLALIRKYREYKWGTCKNNVDLHGKVALVTGANSGIGYETAKDLAKRGAKVIVACRSIKKAKNTISDIQKSLAIPIDMVPLTLDLASIKSIYSFVKELNRVEPRIHILVNNAGVSYPRGTIVRTEDGFEAHMGVNHLGHFLLTKLLLPNLKTCAPSRIVIVASTMHERGKLHLDDLNADKHDAQCSLYADSKLANAYFCKELALRVKDDQVGVYALCPGLVNTCLFRNHQIRWYHYVLFSPIIFWYLRTPKQAVQTVIYCATEPILEKKSGLLFQDCKHYNSPVKFDMAVSKKFWELSDQMIINAEQKLL